MRNESKVSIAHVVVAGTKIQLCRVCLIAVRQDLFGFFSSLFVERTNGLATNVERLTVLNFTRLKFAVVQREEYKRSLPMSCEPFVKN